MTKPPRPPSASGYSRPWVSAFVITAAAVLVFHGSLQLFFAQDDFSALARAKGLLPRLETPFRLLSQQLFFDAMWPLAGTHPFPYHLASLLVHIACSLTLFLLLQRASSLSASLIGALFFACHPASFTAIYWISAIADPLSLFFALASLLALSARRQRWIAIPLFLLALLSKESTVLLPLAAMALISLLGHGKGIPRGDHKHSPRSTIAVLGAISLIYIAYLTHINAMGHSLAPNIAPYAVAFDSTILANLFTYLGWTTNFSILTVRSFSDAVDKSALPWAVATLLGWLIGLLSPSLRRRGWLAGGVAYLAFLTPVLPLKNHTYHYYLYAPLAGAAFCVAAFFDYSMAFATHSIKRGPSILVPALLLAGGLLILNGALLVWKVEHYPFVLPQMRSDPIVDRSRIASNVHTDLQAAPLPPGINLLFWCPTAETASPQIRGDYWKQNVRSALADGLAIRVLFPPVARVIFIDGYTSASKPYLYCVYGVDGHVVLATPEQVETATPP
jgi:hypothetical protein